MLGVGTLIGRRAEPGRKTAVVAAVLLPLSFLIMMAVFSPKTGPLAPVVAALVEALVLRHIEPSMRWPGVVLVTFWFILAAAVGGVLIAVSGAHGLGSLANSLVGLVFMFSLQAGRVFWQFSRAHRLN